MLFTIDDSNYSLHSINRIFDSERLPFGLKDKNVEAQNTFHFINWLRYRGLPESRRDFSDILRNFEANNSMQLSMNSMALNLTDHYWVHPADYDLKWEKYNFFDNSFDELVQRDYDILDLDGSVTTPSPNFCVDGSIIKRWRIWNDERVLLKGYRHKNMQEPYNETIASAIFDYYNIENVNYSTKITKHNNTPFSVCKCMVDKDTEYINAKVVLNTLHQEGSDTYDHYLNVCRIKGLPDAKESIDKMIVIDYILGNIDRHKGNFGIIRNANTLEWLKIAPVFDTGNCLFYNADNAGSIGNKTDSYSKSFKDSNYANLSYIGYPEWYLEKSNKRICEIIDNCLKDNTKITNAKRNKILAIVGKRIQELDKLINSMR